MRRTTRRRKANPPQFKPLTELRAGDPFNPLQTFTRSSLIEALGAYPKLSASAKWVWWVLADQCAFRNTARNSQRTLARLAGVSMDQVHRHLARLVKRKLVAVGRDLGRVNRTWCLLHPLFANCSLLPSCKNAVGGTAHLPGVLPHIVSTHSSSLGSSLTGGSVSQHKATSYGGSVAANGSNHPRKPSSENGNGAVPITGTESPFPLKWDHRFPKNQFTPKQMELRTSMVMPLAEQAAHYRKHLNNPDHTIAYTARRELTRCLAQLSQYGIFIPNDSSKL